jgi:glutathione S-transferase
VKILQTRGAPNPRRVRIFLAEKGIEVPFEEIDLMKGELKTAEFTQMNRFQRVPVLLLDDGTVISETMAICRYFDETKLEPALFGTGPLQRAMVEMWNRRMELNLLFCVAQVFRHLHPAMAHLEVPQVGAWGRPTGQEFWRSCNSWMRNWASAAILRVSITRLPILRHWLPSIS